MMLTRKAPLMRLIEGHVLALKLDGRRVSIMATSEVVPWQVVSGLIDCELIDRHPDYLLLDRMPELTARGRREARLGTEAR